VAKGFDPALIGRTIAGKFVIESYIGAGAMGAVYKAKQVVLEKIVAIKVLHRELTSDESFTARFKREAKAASRLDHPNSMRVIDFGNEPDGLLYIAMEHLDGRDLLQVIVEDWPLSSQRIAGILSQALAALAVAHDMGVVHRDLKPENIMILRGMNDEGLPSDVVKVCDFGIAKITQHRTDTSTDGGGPLTAQGLVVGTPEYMSPEQGKGETLDPRSDLYSMGVILYQLLTGRVPFEAESALGIVFKHVTEEPVAPSQINPVIDRRLEAICLKAMRKRREDRPQNAREMRAELRTVSDASLSVIVPPTSSSPGVDDTAPMPALGDGSRSSGARAVSGPGLGHAPPDPLPKTTSSATFLDGQTRPRAPPSPLLLGVASVLLLGVLGLAFVLHGGSSSSAGDSHGQSNAAAVTPGTSSGSAPTANDTPNANPSADAVPAVSIATSASAAATVSASTRTTASQRDTRARPTSSPPESATATSATGSYDLAVASATPTVVRATGASPRDVRAALPGWQFTVCYRDAMKRLGHRLEGKMSIHLKMGLDGKVASYNVLAPQDLTQAMGNCIADAVTGLQISAASGAGGDADISIAFAPN
jgi:serine/threonine protein kinase